MDITHQERKWIAQTINYWYKRPKFRRVMKTISEENFNDTVPFIPHNIRTEMREQGYYNSSDRDAKLLHFLHHCGRIWRKQ